METMELDRLPTWEYLQKRMTWEQLGEIKGKRVLRRPLCRFGQRRHRH